MSVSPVSNDNVVAVFAMVVSRECMTHYHLMLQRRQHITGTEAQCGYARDRVGLAVSTLIRRRLLRCSFALLFSLLI